MWIEHCRNLNLLKNCEKHFLVQQITILLFFLVSGNYKNLIVTFTFHRRMGFYFIQFYIPCIVMVSLSWISFWMDRYYIGERLSLGVTTILTIVFLLGSSNSTMPRVSYAKAIDWYLLGSFILVFSTLVTDLLVYRFRSKEESRKQEQEDEKEKKVTKCWFFWYSKFSSWYGSSETPQVTEKTWFMWTDHSFCLFVYTCRVASKGRHRKVNWLDHLKKPNDHRTKKKETSQPYGEAYLSACL